jgi:hypothetical protein
MKHLLLLPAALLLAAGAFAQEKKIDAKDVPAPVMTKFKAFYGEVTKVKWEMVGTNYEAEFKGADKKKMAITYSPEGNTLEKEWELKKAELPKAVQDSLAKKFPGAGIDEICKLDKAGLIVYEVEMDVKDKDKKEMDMEVQFTPDGKIWSKMEKPEEKKDNKEMKKDEKKPEDKKDDKKNQK